MGHPVRCHAGDVAQRDRTPLGAADDGASTGGAPAGTPTGGGTPAGGAGVPLTVNGHRGAVTPGDTVADLVRAWCASPDGIAVARNREVVPRSRWATTPLAAHDVVEIVTAAAGG